MAEEFTDDACCNPDLQDSEEKTEVQTVQKVGRELEWVQLSWSDKTDSGQGSSTEKSTILTSEASSKEIGSEPSSFELPKIVEHPVESCELSGASSPSENFTRKASLLSKAKDLASKGVKAIARSLSPRMEPIGSPKTSPSRSPLKSKLRSPKKKGPSEDEGILSGAELQVRSYDKDSAQGTSHTPKENIMQRCKNKFLGSKKASPSSQDSTDIDKPGCSGDTPYKRLTAKQKRSRFAGLINLSLKKTESQDSPKRLVWTPRGATFESDSTEEFDIGSMSSPDRLEDKVPSPTDIVHESSLVDVAESGSLREERGIPEGAETSSENRQQIQEDPDTGGFEVEGRVGDHFSDE